MAALEAPGVHEELWPAGTYGNLQRMELEWLGAAADADTIDFGVIPRNWRIHQIRAVVEVAGNAGQELKLGHYRGDDDDDDDDYFFADTAVTDVGTVIESKAAPFVHDEARRNVYLRGTIDGAAAPATWKIRLYIDAINVGAG